MTATTARSTFAEVRRLVLDENVRLLSSADVGQWDRAGHLIDSTATVFVIGSGRSGLAGQMVAMRLMHLGLDVHVAGEVTAPALGAGNLLIAVSGSGKTNLVVNAGETAKSAGAKVLAVTTAEDSPLAQVADEVIILRAADKNDRSGSITSQYAGSLFEQSVLLGFDALFHALWIQRGRSADQLWLRHANIG